MTVLFHDLPGDLARAAGPFLSQFTPGAHAAIGQGFVRLDKAAGIEHDLGAQAVALGAHAQRRVKAEHGRRQLGKAQPAFRAGIPLRIERLGAIPRVDDDQPIAQAQGGLDRVGETARELAARFRVLGRQDQSIHHQLDVVLDLLVKLDLLAQIPDLAIHSHPRKTVGSGPSQDVLKGTLAIPRQRRQYLETLAHRKQAHLLHDLLRRLGVHLATALRTVRHAHAGKEHPQIVIDLGHRRHRRAGVLAHRFLLDGNRGAEAADEIHLGFFHLADELAGVRRERLDVAPLPLGIERIKGE